MTQVPMYARSGVWHAALSPDLSDCCCCCVSDSLGSAAQHQRNSRHCAARAATAHGTDDGSTGDRRPPSPHRLPARGGKPAVRKSLLVHATGDHCPPPHPPTACRCQRPATAAVHQCGRVEAAAAPSRMVSGLRSRASSRVRTVHPTATARRRPAGNRPLQRSACRCRRFALLEAS